jgi:hypothetical protein
VIEFELKHFSKEFNQNKEFKSVESSKVKIGNYEWNLSIERDLNDSGLGLFLDCTSEEENFPVIAEYKLFIVNQKDERKHKNRSINLKISIALQNLHPLYHSLYLALKYCFEETNGRGYSPFKFYDLLN